MAWTLSTCPRGLIALRDQVADWFRFTDNRFAGQFGRRVLATAGIVHLATVVALVSSSAGSISWPVAALALATSTALCAYILQHTLGTPVQAVSRFADGTPILSRDARAPGSRPSHSQAAHTRDVSCLLAHISHELRTPLNAIIGFSDLMQRELMGPLGSPKYREYASLIKDSGFVLLKAAEDTLALATLSADPFQMQRSAVDVDAQIRDAVRTARSEAAARGITVVVRECDAAALAKAPHQALRQAITSLVCGAVGSLERGGTVEIDVLPRPSGIEMTVTLTRPAGATRGARPAIDPGSRATGPFQISLAHTLFGLQGNHLHTGLGLDGRWRAIVELPYATVPRAALAA